MFLSWCQGIHRWHPGPERRVSNPGAEGPARPVRNHGAIVRFRNSGSGTAGAA